MKFRKLDCWQDDDLELPFHAKLTLENDNTIHGDGQTMASAIERIEHLSGIEIMHWHDFRTDIRGYDVCLFCDLTKGDLDELKRLLKIKINL